jgi:membrane associated rhomboid family serine protease
MQEDAETRAEPAVHFDGQALGRFLEQNWQQGLGSLSVKLIYGCVSVFVVVSALDLLGIASRQQVAALFGLSYVGIFRHQWLYQLLTAPWFELNVQPLVFEVLSLWLFGPSLEKELGRWRFVLLLLLCAAASEAAFLVVARGSNAILMGLSSVTAGLFMAQACFFADQFIPVNLFFRVKLKYAAYLMIAVQLFMTLVSEPIETRWLQLSQLAGPVVGFVFARIWAAGQARRGKAVVRCGVPSQSPPPRLPRGRPGSGDEIPREL